MIFKILFDLHSLKWTQLGIISMFLVINATSRFHWSHILILNVQPQKYIGNTGQGIINAKEHWPELLYYYACIVAHFKICFLNAKINLKKWIIDFMTIKGTWTFTWIKIDPEIDIFLRVYVCAIILLFVLRLLCETICRYDEFT